MFRIASPDAPHLDAVCRMLSLDTPPERRERQAQHYANLVDTGELALDDLFAAWIGDELVGAMLTQLTPGSGAICLAPKVASVSMRIHVEDALVETAVERFRAAGVKVAQSLVSPENRDSALPLERCGFLPITTLKFFTAPVPFVSNSLESAEFSLTFTPQPQPDATFGETLLATYDGTRDCPELNGLRTAAEVIAGYEVAETGLADGPSWVLVSQSGEPIGVLILSQTDPFILDLGYLGLVSSARGFRLGDELVNYVFHRARRSGCEWVRLSYDARNTPAERLYARHGFYLIEAQEVFLWFGPGS